MTDYRITPFDIEKATHKEIESWYELRLDHEREIHPDDPEPGQVYMLKRIIALNNTQDGMTAAAWNSAGEMIGYCRAHVSRAGFRKNAATFGIIVRRSHRRRGVATSMLRHVLETADHFHRSELRAYHNERCPAAECFLNEIGADKTSSSSWNQLDLEEVEDELISEWLKLQSPDVQTVRLTIWDDHYPEDSLEEICEFYQTVTDLQRKEDGEEDSDVKITEEAFRQADKSALSGGTKRLLLHAEDMESGRLIGLTEVSWNPSRPAILKQGYTAVLPDYRGNGIGRRLKAEMIRRIRETIPEAKVVRTGNDDRRKAMLRINSQLGFRHHMTQYGWELEVEVLRSYLSGS